MTRTQIGSLIFFVVGVYGVALSLGLPMGRWNEPGAGAFPLLVSALLSLSGALMFFGERGRREGGPPRTWRATLAEQTTPIAIVGITGGFIALLNPLGYLLAATLYLFTLLFLVSRYRFWMALVLAVAIGVGSWYVFGKLFETPLPEGVLRWM